MLRDFTRSKREKSFGVYKEKREGKRKEKKRERKRPLKTMRKNGREKLSYIVVFETFFCILGKKVTYTS